MHHKRIFIMSEFIIITHAVNKATRTIHFLKGKPKQEVEKVKTLRKLKSK